ncbi:hypothetical protein HYV49_00005, partial [Candidatus Pacearchaeota archaeon]|nr:hypothetical protein [Candidatus Pacearchaeota archaeon]
LEEQNVPVFCQVDAIKLNPFVDVSWIKSISFRGQYPKEVAGVSWHPSRAALRFYSNVLESPILNNVGYVVVLLKKQPNEKDMPDSVKLNITANLIYDLNNAFGTGRASFYVPVLNDNEWTQDYRAYSFWRGRGFVRVDWIKDNSASISIYKSPEGVLGQQDGRVGNVVLQQGQISGDIYLPGFYCRAATRIQLDGIVKPAKAAKIVVDENTELWLREGEKFLDDKCRVTKIDPISEGGEVIVNCLGKRVSLSLESAKSIELTKDNKKLGTLVVGEKVPESSYYLAFSGLAPVNARGDSRERNFIILIKNLTSIHKKAENQFEIRDDYINNLRDKLKSIRSYKVYEDEVKEAVKGIFKVKTEDIAIIFYKESGLIDAGKYSFSPGKGFNKYYSKNIEEYYDNAKEEAANLVRFYQGAKGNSGGGEIVFGENANVQLITLSRDMGKTRDTIELGEEFIKNFPQSNEIKNIQGIIDSTKINDFADSTDLFEIGNTFHRIKLEDIKEPTFDDASASLIINGEKKRIGINDVIDTGQQTGIAEKDNQIIDSTGSVIVKSSESVITNSMNVNIERSIKISVINSTNVSVINSKNIRLVNATNVTIINSKDITLNNAKDKIIKGNENAPIDIISTSETATLMLKDLEDDFAVFVHSYRDKEGRNYEKEERIKIKERKQLVGFDIFVEDINLRKVAVIKIIPRIPNAPANTTLSAQIGIDKRDIKLSDNKTLEMIENLNKSIEKFDTIVNNLGNVVKGWKTACFATSGFMIAKNFFTGLGGGVQARKEVNSKWY